MIPHTFETALIEFLIGMFLGYIVAFVGEIVIKILALIIVFAFVFGNYLGLSPTMSVSEISSQLRAGTEQLGSIDILVYSNIPLSIGFGTGVILALSM